jgi:hypothetical protein
MISRMCSRLLPCRRCRPTAGRPGDLLVGDHDRARGGAAVEACSTILQRSGTSPRCGSRAGRRRRRRCGWRRRSRTSRSRSRARLAQVVRQAGRAQHRAGDAQRHAAGEVEVADALVRPLSSGFSLSSISSSWMPLRSSPTTVADLVGRAVREVLGDAAGADVGHVHPQAGDVLEDPQDPLALAEADGHDRGRAHLHAAGAEADEVGVDPGELHHEHADDAGPLGDLVGDAEELLDRQAVGGLLEHRGEVVHPGAEGHALHPGAELHVLLDAGVQVADARAGLGDGLAVELEDEPEHAVRRRVLRAHVDDDPLLVEGGGLVDEVVPVAAGDVVDRGEPLARSSCRVGVRTRGRPCSPADRG